MTESLIFEGGGRVTRVPGGYESWVEIRDARRRAETEAQRERAGTSREARQQARRERAAQVGRGRAERRELEALPGRIEALEAEQAELHEVFGDPDVYRTDPRRVSAMQARLAEIEGELEAAYRRWEELEG